MGILYREICNGCGVWGNENTAEFYRIGFDLTNYVLFSSGFKLREPKIDIFVCNKCYSEMADLSFKYQTGEEIDRLRKLMGKKDDEIEKLSSELRDFKYSVNKLLQPIKDLEK